MTDKPMRGIANDVAETVARRIARCVVAMFVAISLATLGACGGDSPEARLRAAIAAMGDAVEARQPGDFIERLTEDFAAEGGRIDRQGMRGFLAAQMLGNKRIGVTVVDVDVKLTGADRATVTVRALVTGGDYFPERGEDLKIVSGWRLEDGEWRCFRADRER